MTKAAFIDTVVPARYPGLRQLLWNRDPTQGLPAADAFAIYERNWRHLDAAALTTRERRLMNELTQRFGHGVFLG